MPSRNAWTLFDGNDEAYLFARRIAETLPGLVYVIDIDRMRLVYANAATMSFFGMSPEELSTSPDSFLLDIIHPGDREYAASHMAEFQSLADGETMEFEQRMRHHSGEWRCVAIRETVFQRAPGGRPCRILGQGTDIHALKQGEEALRDETNLLNRAFEASPIGKAIVDLDGRWLRVNPALSRILGYNAEELASLNFQALTHPDDLEKDLDYVARLLAGEIPNYEMEKRYIRKDGGIVWILLSVSLIRDNHGNPRQFVSQIQNIDDRKQAQRRLAEQALKLEEAQRVARIGSWEVRLDTGEIDWSNEMYRLYGFDPSGGMPDRAAIRARYHPSDIAELDRVTAQARTDGRPFSYDLRVIRPDMEVIWLHFVGQGEMRDGRVKRLFGTALDITERKNAEQTIQDYSVVLESKMKELEALAMRDGLTNLLNHRSFHERLHETFNHARLHGLPLSVIMLDVDHFKQYNDTYGHPEGDGVLRHVAQILNSTCRTSDVCARYGGEEFAMILPRATEHDAHRVAERLRATIEAESWPMRPITISVGIATLTPRDADDRDLVRRADAALYTSKQTGRNRISQG